MANGNGLASVDHIVVLMLENRSFGHMLGYLYPGNVTPSGQPFEGLAGTESNPDSNGQPVAVFPIEPATANAWNIVSGTTANDIMGCYSPAALPVLSALAKGYAVRHQWFCSVPTQTLPNRAFTCSATSQGYMDPVASPSVGTISHLEQVREELQSRESPTGPAA
jgi:phospholipase C